MRLRPRFAYGIVIALALTIGATTATPAPSSVHSLPRALVGSFSTKLGSEAYPPLVPGRYTLSLAANGALSMTEPGVPKQFVTTVTVSGDRFVFLPAQKCPTQKGAYRWAVHAGILTFVKVADPCRVRVITFAHRNWVRVK